MRTLTSIIGYSTDEDISDQLHNLHHDDRVEYLILDREDTLRRRLRIITDKGTDCAVALSREQKLEDGSVLSLSEQGAIVVRMKKEPWLRTKPRDLAAALELGYFAGNLHWRVRFVDGLLDIAIEGPASFYLGRLQPYVDNGKVEVVPDD
jgi:urease accessory protein